MNNPLVSIIVPHRTDRPLRCMESIKSQTHQNIEVIVIDDPERRGASWARNEGWGKADGAFIFFCDDDITLDEKCIEKMVTAIQEKNVDFVYCNYEMTGARTRIHTAKPFDLEHLKNCNYISTMSLVRSNIYSFDERLERFQDWDYWLTMAENGCVGYWIDEVLFSAHFDEDSISTRGRSDMLKHTRLIYEKHNIKGHGILSIIIAVHNQADYLKDCLNSLSESFGFCSTFEQRYQVIIVNDKSDKATEDVIAEHIQSHSADFVIVNNDEEERWFTTKAWNKGLEKADGWYVCILNSDTILSENWATPLIKALRENPNLSCVGPMTSHSASPQCIKWIHEARHRIVSHIDNIRSLLPDIYTEEVQIAKFCMMMTQKTLFHIGSLLPDIYTKDVQIAKITGFCMMMTQEALFHIGPFDEDIPAGGNEADWIIRGIKKDLYPAICTWSYVHHLGGGSYTEEERESMWKSGNAKVVEKHGQEMMDYLEKTLYQKLTLK